MLTDSQDSAVVLPCCALVATGAGDPEKKHGFANVQHWMLCWNSKILQLHLLVLWWCMQAVRLKHDCCP